MSNSAVIHRKLTFTGGSFVFRIPKGFLDSLGIGEGDKVAIQCEGECIKITRAEDHDVKTMTKLASVRQRHDYIMNLSATASINRSAAIQASQQEALGSLVQRAFGLMVDGAFYATRQEVSTILKWLSDHGFGNRSDGYCEIVVCRSVIAEALLKRIEGNREQGVVSLQLVDVYDLMGLRRSVWRASVPGMTDEEAGRLMKGADQGTDAFLKALLEQFEVAIRITDGARPLIPQV